MIFFFILRHVFCFFVTLRNFSVNFVGHIGSDAINDQNGSAAPAYRPQIQLSTQQSFVSYHLRRHRLRLRYASADRWGLLKSVYKGDFHASKCKQRRCFVIYLMFPQNENKAFVFSFDMYHRWLVCNARSYFIFKILPLHPHLHFRQTRTNRIA